MNKEKREKKQKKKKTEDSGIGDLIIKDNMTSDFSHLSTFNMESLLKETAKVLGQCTKENKNNREPTTSIEDHDQKSSNVNQLSDVAQRLINLCESI
ncbi:uncharacterized protein AC631_00240 [Debaryomyces fabryi]|uniref:Uncharacterized protein n=1 Tax=Debaryomyces fabryi TaxID=58627 RepID=A0A0V1Q673_9ASCO|nr:uncharacterized protein AC631_00240 [Debaryomyces fabryi]KSA03970.1 hypothetical protein AC631_00240 [Debaryomyces fabryi]CUM53832.1 unnamed protein product [Debaryomyces fabryi]